jgi:hypothetical protein
MSLSVALVTESIRAKKCGNTKFLKRILSLAKQLCLKKL